MNCTCNVFLKIIFHGTVLHTWSLFYQIKSIPTTVNFNFFKGNIISRIILLKGLDSKHITVILCFLSWIMFCWLISPILHRQKAYSWYNIILWLVWYVISKSYRLKELCVISYILIKLLKNAFNFPHQNSVFKQSYFIVFVRFHKLK